MTSLSPRLSLPTTQERAVQTGTQRPISQNVGSLMLDGMNRQDLGFCHGKGLDAFVEQEQKARSSEAHEILRCEERGILLTDSHSIYLLLKKNATPW